MLVAAAVFAQAPGSTSWPMYRHDDLRAGKADPGALPGGRLSPIWVFPKAEGGGGTVDNDFSGKPDVADFISTPLGGTPGLGWTEGNSDMAPNGYNGNFLWSYVRFPSQAAVGQPPLATATWTFPLAGQGSSLAAYYIHVWFPSHAYGDQPMHATRAKYTVEIVNDDLTVASTETFTVDQSSGGNWIALSSSARLVADNQFVRVILTNEVPDIDAGKIVCADAVMLSTDTGHVLASPAFAPNGNADRTDDLVVTCVTENRSLETVTTMVPVTDEFGNGTGATMPMAVQSGTVRVGAIHGLYAEKQGTDPAVDERGTVKWSFPFDQLNWIAGGFSSSPTIHRYTYDGGPRDGQLTEAAYCAALDGQIYVVDTRNTVDDIATNPQELIWQGPGYIDDDPSGASWTQAFRAGRYGADFLQTAAVAPGGTEIKATWKVTVKKKGNYAVYAWIPPSSMTGNAIGVPDARYTVSIGADHFNASADQRSGGRWALLGKYEVDAANTSVQVDVSNVSEIMRAAGATARAVFADAIKIVPSELGVFDWSSPLISDDGNEIYVGTTTGRLYCFEIGEEDPKWVYPAVGENPMGAIHSSPTLSDDGDFLYVGSSDGHIYKVKISDGSEAWSYPEKPTSSGDPVILLGQISSSVAVRGDRLYFGIGSDMSLPPTMSGDGLTGRVVCLKDNGDDAEQVWQYPADGEEARGSFLYSSPMLFNTGLAVGDVLAVGSTDGALIGLNPSDGTELPDWVDGAPDIGEAIYSSPAGVTVNESGVTIPMAYVGTQGGALHGIDLRYGRKFWSYGLTGAAPSSPALAEDRLYIGDMNGLTWAFSSRSGSGSDGREDWNNLGDPTYYPPGNETEGDSDKVSNIQVDIFHRADWEAVKSGIEVPHGPITDGDLHKIARAQRDGITADQPGHNHRPAIPYEWGETVYIIAWNCLDPNNPDPAEAPNEQWPKGGVRGSAYQDATDSTVRLTIKSRGPGDQSDQSTALTMTEKGSFMDQDGKVIYYTKYAYVLGTSSASSTQAPGSRINISVQELPSTKSGSWNKGATAGDCVVPEHSPAPNILPKKPHPLDPGLPDIYDNAKFEPQRIAINNPLGLMYKDPDSLNTVYVGVEPSGTNLVTDRGISDPNSYVHVNDNRGRTPNVRAGLVAHGTSSDERIVVACDRSLLSLAGSRLTKFRMEREDLGWNGGPDQIWTIGSISTQLPWELAPPRTGPNASLDYPDIRMRQVGFTMAESRVDPTQEAADLRPSPQRVLPQPGTAKWVVGPNPVAQVVSVPKHQPANMPRPWPATTSAALDATGYTGHSYAFIDSNGDGRLNRSGSLGSSQLYQQSVTGARSEAYRRFHSQVHVPPDYRIDLAERTYDLGAVPHGFGLTPTGGVQPAAFYRTLGDNVKLDLPGGGQSSPLDPSLDVHFKNFTAYNDGNINALNLRLAKVINPATGPTYGLDLFSDTAEGGVYMNGGRLHAYGAHVPAAGIVSALDRRFVDPSHPLFVNHPANLRPVAAKTGATRTFHKPRVGDSPTVLRLPDVPPRLYRAYGFDASRTPEPLLPSMPFFSVAVPVGVPVGTYSRSLTLFEDMNGNDIFDPGEAVGNPAMDVKVTITENRMTDGFMPGARPQIDVPVQNAPKGDVSPAAYIDAEGNLQMYWSSSRLNGIGTPGDPWYIYKSRLPWTTGAWDLKPNYHPGFWMMSSPTPGSDQWWSAISQPYPTPATLPSFFAGGPGTVQQNSVKFTGPSIATLGNQSWMFFGGQATRHNPATDTKEQEYKAFYWPLSSSGDPVGSAMSSTRDWTMPKYGIKGVGADLGRQTLWTFWYGGNNSQWRLYYNMSPLKSSDTVGDAASWSNDARLPLPRGISSAAEPSVISRTVYSQSGNPRQVLDVFYSAYSQYHKNTDIYLSRYRPDLNDVTNGAVEMNITSLPLVRGEVLVRDPASAIYSSRHIDWDTDNMSVYVDAPGFGGPRRLDIDSNGYRAIRDPQTHALVYTYSDPSDAAQVENKRLFRSVVIDTGAGTVKFLRDPGRDALVTATYEPRAYRLTTDGAADTGPSVLFETSPNVNPRALVHPENFWTSGGSLNNPPADRLWVFWRRPSTTMRGTGVFYKSFRYTIRLNDQIAKNAIDDLEFVGDQPAGPVEIDWAKKRLYFTTIDDGKVFSVRYPNALGAQVPAESHTVTMEEELDLHGNAFGNLTSEVSNEGQVCVVRDPDQYVNKLWVFWTSARAGNTDVYYETICPRFYANELN